MSGSAEAKAAARKAAFARRLEAHRGRGLAVTALLQDVLARYRGRPVSGYMPILSEIDPRPAMIEASQSGRVGTPVILGKGKPLRFARWDQDTEMEEGPFGALVPVNPIWMEPEILIVPLVAFTRDGGRLGYGGGFYDRTLAQIRRHRPVVTIGFAYAAQEAATLPLDETDQRLDFIVTERDVFDARPAP